MNRNAEEFVSRSFPAQGMQTLNIVCKNYRVRLEPGEGDEISICYYNNRFRSLEVRKGNRGLFLEERMAVTFYEFFRLMELMEKNELVVKLPASCTALDIAVETGVTEIYAEGLVAQNIRLLSASGPICVRNVCVGKSLFAHSTAGKVRCLLPGAEDDYDIDCRAERRDVVQPYYPANHNAGRKVVLRSNMSVPELAFTGEKACEAQILPARA